MPENIGKLLKKARRAYKSGERGAAAFYIDKILGQDYTHRGTWQLLYREYGSGQSLQDFQREFTDQYYPEKLALISGKQAAISQREGKSLLERIFPRRKTDSSDKTQLPPKEEKAPEAIGRSKKTGSPKETGGRQGLTQKTETGSAAARDVLPTDLPEAAHGTTPKSAEDTPKIPLTRVNPPPEAPLSEQFSPFQQAAANNKPAAERQDNRLAHVQPFTTETAPLPQRMDRSGNIRVIVVDDTAQTRETIVRSLSFQKEIEIIDTAENGLQAIALARQTQPDVILMDINMPDMDGITATAGVLHEVPYAQVIILTVQDDPDYMRKAMMAGAHDFLTKPPALEELLNAVQNAGRVAHQEKRKAAQSMLAASRLSPSLASRGKVISIHSPKGGVGCSTIAANLAACLHNDETKSVLLDSNLVYGDIIDLFNMQSQNTLFDLAMRAGSLDYQMVEETLVTHESGIHLLASPGPEHAGYVNTEQFIEVVENLRDLYPYVLVNTTSHLTEATIAALEASDLVIVVVTQDIPSVARVRKFLDTTQLLNIQPQRVMLLLNQYDKQSDINPEIIGKSLRHDVEALIPKDVRVVLPSVNRGIPFMLRSDLKPLPISRAMLDLAEKVRQRLVQVATQKEEDSSAGSRLR